MRRVVAASLVLALATLGFLGAALAGQFAPGMPPAGAASDAAPADHTTRDAWIHQANEPRAVGTTLHFSDVKPIFLEKIERPADPGVTWSFSMSGSAEVELPPHEDSFFAGGPADVAVSDTELRVATFTEWRTIPLAPPEVAAPAVAVTLRATGTEPGTYVLLVQAEPSPSPRPNPEPLHRVQGPTPPPPTDSEGEWQAVLVVVTPDRAVAVYALGSAAIAPVGATAPVPGALRAQSRSQARAALLESLGPAWVWLAVAAAVMVLWGTGNLRAGAPLLAAGLFSRFDRDDVLRHDRRNRLYECIRAEPGIAFGRLCEIVGLENGAAQHHLQLLVQHGLVRRVRDGRATRFFLAGGPRIEFALGVTPARERVLLLVRSEAGLSASQVAARIGQRVQTAWIHLEGLRAAGLVTREKRGRATSWRIAAA